MATAGIGASSLDVNSIVSQLMTVERRPLSDLDRKEAAYQAQLTAFGTLKGALSSFKSALAGMTSQSKFQGMEAKLADTTIGTATGSAGATAGTYALQVNQLSQAQNLIAAGQASATAAIGGGTSTTITFQFGAIAGGTLTNGQYSGATFTQDAAQATKTVTIDSSNNSLQGIRDAINAANVGVTAAIVNDGGTNPNRLVLTSNTTGAKSSMKISVTGEAAIGSLLAYDPTATQNLTQVAAGQNASVSINGVAVSSATNRIDGALPGVTLNVTKTGSTTVTVSRDVGTVGSAVTGFVKAYNDLNAVMKNLTAYDAGAKKGGTLNGDAATRTIGNRLRETLGTQLTGLSGKFTALYEVGVSFAKDGTLAFDNAKLQKAFETGYADIGTLFAATGKATDSLLSFAGTTSATAPGTYDVTVTQIATQGSTTGTFVPVPSTTITAGVNDLITLTVDGVAATVTLAPGNYTPGELASQVQSAINGTLTFSTKGIAVSAAIDGSGAMSLTSNRYGSSSAVSVTGGTAQADLFGAPASTTVGLDAAGTIGGQAATGSGQQLTGATGSGAEGLKIQVLGGALGARGTVSHSQGYAYKLDKLIDEFIADSGIIKGRTDGVSRSIEDIGKQRDRLNDRMDDIEKRYRKQFTSLDSLLTRLQSTSQYLTQQLASLPNNNSK